MSKFNILTDDSTELMVTAEVQRRALVQGAFRLERLTIAWMIVEAAVAIGAAVAAHGLLLMAFGIDSAIELTSACVLIWRLSD